MRSLVVYLLLARPALDLLVRPALDLSPYLRVYGVDGQRPQAYAAWAHGSYGAARRAWQAEMNDGRVRARWSPDARVCRPEQRGAARAGQRGQMCDAAVAADHDGRALNDGG